MKLKLSVAGLEQVKTRWAQKQKEGWTREHLCTEASQFAEPDTNCNVKKLPLFKFNEAVFELIDNAFTLP